MSIFFIDVNAPNEYLQILTAFKHSTSLGSEKGFISKRGCHCSSAFGIINISGNVKVSMFFIDVNAPN